MSILATESGTVKFQDLKPGVTVSQEVDEITGMRQSVVIEAPGQRKLNPNIVLLDKNGKKIGNYILPTGSHLCRRWTIRSGW